MKSRASTCTDFIYSKPLAIYETIKNLNTEIASLTQRFESLSRRFCLLKTAVNICSHICLTDFISGSRFWGSSRKVNKEVSLPSGEGNLWRAFLCLFSHLKCLIIDRVFVYPNSSGHIIYHNISFDVIRRF